MASVSFSELLLKTWRSIPVLLYLLLTLSTYLSFHFIKILSSVSTVLWCWGTLPSTHTWGVWCCLCLSPQSLYRPVSNSKVYAGKKSYSGQRRIKSGTAWIAHIQIQARDEMGSTQGCARSWKMSSWRHILSFQRLRVEGGPVTGERQILFSSSKRQERSQHTQPHHSLSGDYGVSLHRSRI